MEVHDQIYLNISIIVICVVFYMIMFFYLFYFILYLFDVILPFCNICFNVSYIFCINFLRIKMINKKKFIKTIGICISTKIKKYDSKNLT